MGERRHDKGAGESPWMSMLDPAANARALGEIQRRGLRAAGELVDRLIGTVDGDRHEDPAAAARSPAVPRPAGVDGVDGDDGPSGTDGSAGRAPGSPDARVAGSASADLLQVWMDLLQRGLQAMAGMARPDGELAPAAGSSATVDMGRGAATGAVHLSVAGDGLADIPDGPEGSDGRTERTARTGSAEVWLHNGTADRMTGLRLHGGDLRAHDGSTLPESALRFDPPSIDELPARSSRGVVVVADVAEGVPGGVYRGVLLVAGAPEVWLPIVVTVASGE